MPNERLIELPDLERIAEKRGEVRYSLNGLVPATVQGLDGEDMDVVMLDVSRGGLGILVSGFPNRVGDILQLCIEGQDAIALIVRWMRRSRLGENMSLPGLTRVGLAVQASENNLLQRLESFGCIDQ
ncbi:MAG: PilZ domain-containing protein [Pseudobdellovibrionaceae bacterium]|nr:PilZ domain-containing protein [Pseudobdellovibrionaceae bacterium]